jgi:ABC-2 type transport system ATP-binding protein
MKTIIKVNNLKKIFKQEIKKHGFIPRLKSIFKWEYKEIDAVSDISFEVKSWEKIAFLWPNWAWKSTTIKMLTWILKETSWEINVLWFNPNKDREKLVYKIWAVFWQTSRLWYHLSAYDTFVLFWKLFDIPNDKFKSRLDYLIKEFEVEKFMNSPVRKLSLWQRMRCEVVASLIHNPEIIFLDEPTIWLDMIAKQKLRKVINKINKEEKTTIFLTSHDIWDIEEICDRVIIINYWKVLYDWDLKKLKKEHIKSKILKIKLEKEIKKLDFPNYVKVIKNQLSYLELEIPNNKENLKEIFNILNNNYHYDDITITEPSMEEIIKTFY